MADFCREPQRMTIGQELTRDKRSTALRDWGAIGSALLICITAFGLFAWFLYTTEPLNLPRLGLDPMTAAKLLCQQEHLPQPLVVRWEATTPAISGGNYEAGTLGWSGTVLCGGTVATLTRNVDFNDLAVANAVVAAGSSQRYLDGIADSACTASARNTEVIRDWSTTQRGIVVTCYYGWRQPHRGLWR